MLKLLIAAISSAAYGLTWLTMKGAEKTLKAGSRKLRFDWLAFFGLLFFIIVIFYG